MPITFGLALDFGWGDAPLEPRLRSHLKLAQLGEQYGFDSVWAGENYPQPGAGAPHLSSPFLLLAALAPNIGLKLGTGVILLPGYHPLRLAYDTAVLDQLSGGRLVLGVGLGRAGLPTRFGLDPARRAELMDDSLKMLRAMWSGANGFKGSYIEIEGGIAPLPARPGGPTLLVGGSIRRSVERAAEWGDGWYASSSYLFDRVERQSRGFLAALEARDKDPVGAIVSANRLTLVADDESTARSQAARHIGDILQNYAGLGSFGSDPELKTASNERLLERLGRDVCLVGTPDQVIEQVRRYAAVGVTHLQARVSPANTPYELAARSIELLGRHVLPAFR